MAKNRIEISLQKEMEDLGQSIKKVTSAIFEGRPGVAPTIPGKRKSAQVTFKIHSANDKRSLQSQARRAFLEDFMRKNGPRMEIMMKKAMEAVIAGLVGGGGSSVTVFGRSLGIAKPRRRIEDEPFAKFIMSKEGAGEIGLPDPEESLRNLKAALMTALTVDALSRTGFSPQLKFVFDQNHLLKRTPHPNQRESGAPSPFFSWLSLVTGPGFAKGGTPGYGLVRIHDLRNSLRASMSKAKGGVRGMRRAQITENLIRASRTHGNAGELAAIMMKTRKSGRGKSPAEAFGGVTEDYQPSAKFEGFWDLWWAQTKIELNVWARKVLRATMRGILRG